MDPIQQNDTLIDQYCSVIIILMAHTVSMRYP